MSINVNLLKNVCEIAGAPGFEQPIRQLLLEQLEPLVDKLTVDNLGNVIALKKGRSSDKKVMLAAHMDEISFIVTHIDDKGFIKFIPLGGFDPKTLTAQRVIVHGKEDVIGVMGSKPIHLMTAEERGKKVRIQDFFVDTGMSKEEVEAIVSVGNPITRQRTFIEMGDCVNSKSIDNRVSVFILLEMLRELQNETVPYDTYGVFTVQEEIGLRGAIASSLDIVPDFAFCVDTTIAYDTPNAAVEERVTELGKGTAIKIMDSRVICDYRMVRFMKATADKHNITWQPEILPLGGTDTSAMQLFGRAICGAVSIPTRHIHQSIEMAHKGDIRYSIDLLKVCVSEVDTYDFKFV